MIVGYYVTLSCYLVCARKTLLPNKNLTVYFHFTSKPAKTRKEKPVYSILLDCGTYTFAEISSKSFLPGFTTFNLKMNKIKVGAV